MEPPVVYSAETAEAARAKERRAVNFIVGPVTGDEMEKIPALGKGKKGKGKAVRWNGDGKVYLYSH